MFVNMLTIMTSLTTFRGYRIPIFQRRPLHYRSDYDDDTEYHQDMMWNSEIMLTILTIDQDYHKVLNHVQVYWNIHVDGFES